MDKGNAMALILRWVARVSSVLYLVLFLFLLGASLMGESREVTMTLAEKISFGCVAAYFIGLILAWEKEMAGGVLALCSTAAFAAVLRDAPNALHLFMVSPALLFIVSHLLTCLKNKGKETSS